VTTNVIHSRISSPYALDNQNATTVTALPRTLSTSVFCLPATSAMKPMPMRLTVLTALLIDNRAAPLSRFVSESQVALACTYKAAVYPSRVLNSGRNVRGTRFPAACDMAATACKMNVGRLANLTSTRVGLLARLLDGGVLNTIGIQMAKLTNPNVLNDQAAPTFSSRARAAGP
jgi:hypothetical protein